MGKLAKTQGKDYGMKENNQLETQKKKTKDVTNL